jgi:hypothetical protein
MTNNAEATKEQGTRQAPKTAEAKSTKADVTQAVKAKEPQSAKTAKTGGEAVDRLPATVDELKASKGGLVCFLFLAGKDKQEITKELNSAFDLSDTQALKIIRRITGRVRFFRRVFDLMAAK